MARPFIKLTARQQVRVYRVAQARWGEGWGVNLSRAEFNARMDELTEELYPPR